MDQKASTSEETLSALKREVENYANRRMVTPADFDFLAEMVTNATQRPISSTTLKRVWGYIRDTGEDYMPGRFTLCTLAEFIGYRDIEDFDEKISHNTTIQSDFFFGLTIGASEIPILTDIEVTWAPDRKVVIRCISPSTFEVISSINSKLIAGDIIECHSFTQNAPLYISRVSRIGAQEFTYTAGMRTGVHYCMLPNDSGAS